MKTITLCSSGSFYSHVNDLRNDLVGLGYNVVVPSTVDKMVASDDFDIEQHKTWYQDEKMLGRKGSLMREHFDAIANGDAVLVVNDEKRGVEGYIGPNVLMEMGLAFYLRKPIYVLNAVSKGVSCWEEVAGFGSIILDGDINKIKL